MITQKYKQGQHEIKIEIAENIDEAGQYPKFYIDGKPVDNYMAMMRFITEETKNNRKNIVPSDNDLMSLRKKMLDTQEKNIHDELQKLKEYYKDMNVPDKLLNSIDAFEKKINSIGVRVHE
jgi:hypothetical protein